MRIHPLIIVALALLVLPFALAALGLTTTSATEVVIFVRPAVAGQAVTVPLIVTDACGPWETFVGVGTGG